MAEDRRPEQLGKQLAQIMARVKKAMGPEKVCPECGQPTYVRALEILGRCPDCQQEREAAQEEREAQAARFLLSGLPEEAKGLHWRAYTLDDHNREAADYLRTWGYGKPGAFLGGHTGTGKTFSALCFLMARFREGCRVQYINVPKFFQAYKNSFSTRNPVPRDILQRAKSSRFLLLDDIGVGASLEFAQDTLLPVVESRLDQRLCTLYTSNCALTVEHAEKAGTLDEFGVLADAVGSRLTSRIIKSVGNGAHVYNLGGPDRRMG